VHNTSAEAIFRFLYQPELAIDLKSSSSGVQVEMHPVRDRKVLSKLKDLGPQLLGAAVSAQIVIRGQSKFEFKGIVPEAQPLAIAVVQPLATEYFQLLSKVPPQEIVEGALSLSSNNFLLDAPWEVCCKTIQTISIRSLCPSCIHDEFKKSRKRDMMLVPGICENHKISPLRKQIVQIIKDGMRALVAEFIHDEREHWFRQQQPTSLRELLESLASFSITFTAEQVPGADGVSDRSTRVTMAPFFHWSLYQSLLHWADHHWSLKAGTFTVTLKPLINAAQLNFEAETIDQLTAKELPTLGSVTEILLKYFNGVLALPSFERYEEHIRNIVSGLFHHGIKDARSFVSDTPIMFVCRKCNIGTLMITNEAIRVPGPCLEHLTGEVAHQLHYQLGTEVRRALLAHATAIQPVD